MLELIGNVPLNEILSDWTEVSLDAESDAWLGLPPPEFLEFVRAYPATPFDAIPHDPSFLREPSYLVHQAHRMWQTASLVNREIGESSAHTILDLGSHPFCIPLLLRDYFGFDGRLIASTNVGFGSSQLDFLTDKGIEVVMADLDPFVSDPATRDVTLPSRIPVDDGSADLVCSSHVIEHLYHPISMISECQRVLAPRGRLLITTDNAMMIDVFLNYVAGYGYIFEPIEQTAAMTFSDWRGHVRLFTERDLRSLVESLDFTFDRAEFSHVIYESLFEEYFARSVPTMATWKRRMLADIPWLRNDIAVVARRN